MTLAQLWEWLWLSRSCLIHKVVKCAPHCMFQWLTNTHAVKYWHLLSHVKIQYPIYIGLIILKCISHPRFTVGEGTPLNINCYCMPKDHIDGINGQMQHKVTFLQLTNRWSTCQKIQTLPLHSGSKKRTWMQGWDMSLYSKCYLNPHFSIENIEILLDVWENCPFRCTIAFILLPFILLSIKCTC